MDIAGSSCSSSPPDLISPRELKNCEVCGKQGHGNHFGVITCRACAAFFRRFGLTSNFHHKKDKKRCGNAINGSFGCKMCRLQKCIDIGMTSHNFQFLRDSFHRKNHIMVTKIPPSMSTFTGRPNLIIYCAPSEKSQKTVIDVQFLLEKASNVLMNGAETPILAANSLEKLSFGFQYLRKKPDISKAKVITKVGRDQTFELWQSDVLKVSKWLTYFDEFQELPHQQKMDMLKGIWIIWSRLEKLATIAMTRREKICEENQVFLDIDDCQVVFEMGSLEIDLSWCSKYTFEQLKFFGKPKVEIIDEMIRTMMNLQPSDVELTYMLCQLCLHHVGRRYQGEILEVTDRLQGILADNLHEYYSNRMGVQNYSRRIANMMKINNWVRQGIQQRRAKVELMNIFDVFYVEYSDPEMFVDF
ncbi:hypothetical protein L5515_006652 [Caenorhabditis briggsae]|uniref:Uncharacterized protein n=2 Tax=Caenorhabditis briggsae TaxID=6238 RepID=A0AAE9EWG7_CAEBR|nr:hypothetical protein L5515_006652 [Caenorhabditis briggsae]